MAIYDESDWMCWCNVLNEMPCEPSVKELLSHPSVWRLAEVGTIHSTFKWVVSKSFTRIDVHGWDCITSRIDTAESCDLLFVATSHL